MVLLLHELQPPVFSNGRKEPRLSPDTRSIADGTGQLPWPQIEREQVEALGKKGRPDPRWEKKAGRIPAGAARSLWTRGYPRQIASAR
jgi:hypothetical protein